ncbi:FAD-binding protein [Crossiella cryophila]|uniref:2-polyprenyl-6-methoxyphenol hydroxylase-like FAD-dependent oxidoreductase n=1 Tax=Crossiella cryophila TaxID=43355 RepID=A0A7W7CMD9_9PSEU|nr:FAD-binding protein [Crossiella cryophila]MBB4682458.1 2-polyprenyl-6-methoxyphenol hydroxylase-like FAD-dependent oxidoreductase [Crossiella cryophila]
MSKVDVLVVGAGPVGLLCALLGRLYGLRVLIVDKSSEPLRTGRADALNARSLQLLEIVGLFAELYPLGKTCNTSSVWADGEFVSRQSTWWDNLEGCFHKHFLMLGQAFVERSLDRRVGELDCAVRRNTSVEHVELGEDGCRSILSSGEVVESRFVIGADGSRSAVRDFFAIPFEITRPELTWAVLDGVFETDFPKVPEIIVFQVDTSDVAWIPREGEIDRFYVRMDVAEFDLDQVVAKINRAVRPHELTLKRVEWFSRFSVKESVAERFSVGDRVFLAGDACHIHSVNGGQGLNTGLSDAFNLMWKLGMAANAVSSTEILRTYEQERKPVALSVVETSGALVRSTKYSEGGTHAVDYVKTVERKAGNITGMGIRYGEDGLAGSRLFDFMVHGGDGGLPVGEQARVYSLLDYRFFTLLVFGDAEPDLALPPFVRTIRIRDTPGECPYPDQLLLVRPDSYIAASAPIDDASPIVGYLRSLSQVSVPAWPS